MFDRDDDGLNDNLSHHQAVVGSVFGLNDWRQTLMELVDLSADSNT